jgi:sulfonate transport system permease protein
MQSRDIKSYAQRLAELVRSLAVGLIIPFAVIAAWQIFSNLGYVNQSIFTNPQKILETFQDYLQKDIYFKHVSVSLLRILNGFVIGSVIGFLVGALVALFKTINNLTSVLISLLRPIPPISCIPFLILWLGIKEESKIAIIVIGTFWPVLLNTIAGIKSADVKLLELAQAFGKSKLDVLLKIVLPSAFPNIFTGLRLGISSAWNCVVTAEMIAASAGLGYLVSYGRELSRPHILFMGIASIGIFGLIIDVIVIRLQKKVIYWTESPK